MRLLRSLLALACVALAARADVLSPVTQARVIDRCVLRAAPDGRAGMVLGTNAVVYGEETSPGTWTTETVETEGCVDDLDLVYDAAGSPVVVFGGAALRVGRRSAGAWSIETVAARPALAVAAAWDGAGRLAIAWQDASQGLMISRHDGTAWSSALVDPGSWGASCSLAFDAAGSPWIAHQSLSALDKSLRVARWTGAAWARDVVDTPTDRTGGTALVMLSGGRAAVAYQHDDDSIHVATFAAGTWTSEYVAAGISLAQGGVGLVADSADTLQVGYVPVGASSVRVARRDAAGWTSRSVAGGSWCEGVTLATAPGGLRAGFRERPGGTTLARASTEGATGSWSTAEVTRLRAVTQASSALDPLGRPAIAFGVDGAATLATWQGADWSLETIASSCSEAFVAFDAGGAPAVTCGRTSGLDLFRWDGAAWTSERVVNRRYVAPSGLVFVGPDPLILFREGQYDRVTKAARWTGAAWTEDTITGIAIGVSRPQAGAPGVGFAYRETGDRVSIATWDGAAWTTELVASPTSLTSARQPDFRWDPSDEPAVTYEDGSTLVLARRSGGVWTPQAIDTAGSSPWSRFAFDGTGAPVVAYGVDVGTSGSTQLARWNGAAWDRREIDPEAPMALDLLIDSVGEPGVSFIQSCQERLVHLFASLPVVALSLHRARIADRASAWQATFLPLTSANDEEAVPFPVAGSIPLSALDCDTEGVSLTLYRALAPGDVPLGSGLRVRREGSCSRVTYP